MDLIAVKAPNGEISFGMLNKLPWILPSDTTQKKIKFKANKMVFCFKPLREVAAAANVVGIASGDAAAQRRFIFDSTQIVETKRLASDVVLPPAASLPNATRRTMMPCHIARQAAGVIVTVNGQLINDLVDARRRMT